MSATVLIFEDVYLSRYLIEIMWFLNFTISEMSTVTSILLGCFNDIYFALTIL